VQLRIRFFIDLAFRAGLLSPPLPTFSNRAHSANCTVLKTAKPIFEPYRIEACDPDEAAKRSMFAWRLSRHGGRTLGHLSGESISS